MDHDDDWEDVQAGSGAHTCVDRWQNAGPKQQKKMFSLFDEMVIFLLSCWHCFALLISDMIKMGEW